MTKQEEIREELARRLAIRDDKGFLNHTTLKYKITDEQYEFTDRILRGLHFQGVVIRVDGELLDCPICEGTGKFTFVATAYEGTYEGDCLNCGGTGKTKTDYVAVEPLIKE